MTAGFVSGMMVVALLLSGVETIPAMIFAMITGAVVGVIVEGDRS